MGRREIENYFIDSYQELSTMINENCEYHQVSSQDVELFVKNLLGQTDNPHLFKYKGSIEDPLKHIIGSRVLELLFHEFGLHYNKVYHGTQIVNCLLQSNSEKLEPIKDLLEDFING